MNEKVYDIITIGGGPSGLLCAITAVTGIPINPTRRFTGLVLDKDAVGEFAWYARLRITHKWYLQGHEVISILKQEASRSGIELHSHEKVINVTLRDNLKIVETEKNRYLARKLAICTGFYPYGNLIRFSESIRPIFGPIDWEVPYIPQEKKYKIVIIGGSNTTRETALRLRELRPDLQVILVIDDYTGDEIPARIAGMSCYQGNIEVKTAGKKKIKLTITNREHKSSHISCRYALINYNSYIHHTGATGFLDNLGIRRVHGYVPVDADGNTGIEGIVAAGNIVTPVSGVLTALATGFTAGLNLYTQLYREYFDQIPVLYPWLPLDNPLQHVLVRDTGHGEST